jgi:hypothetical protein
VTTPSKLLANPIGRASDIIPWTSTRIAVKPFQDMWSFNPSLHYDGDVWRMIVRCADYAMPGGVQIRGPNADHFGVQTRNVMVHLDPKTWKVTETFAMREIDGLPRNNSGNRGYEDVRLFHTELWGLQGIGASAHLDRGNPNDLCAPEQVLLSFDDAYNITHAHPIRGEEWGGPQKNWSPFDEAEEPRFLYAIDRGIVFGVDGPIVDAEPEPGAIAGDSLSPLDVAPAPAPAVHPPPPSRRYGHLPVNGVEFRRVAKLQAVEAKSVGRRHYAGLRGGSQLVYLGDDQWIGIAHEGRLERGHKFYWHTFYTVNSNGKPQRVGPPLKLATEKIEFAAGMVLDGDRLVISYGVDDAECHIGITDLSAVMETMQPFVAEADAPAPSPIPRRLTVGTSSTPLKR